MGTRAIISVNKKVILATHWDGYPENLGTDLLKTKTISQIIRVAKKYSIDSAHISIHKKISEERFKKIAKEHHLSMKKVREGYRRTEVYTPKDWAVGRIKNYGDWAEYQYDLRNGKWYYRKLSGTYPESLKKAGKWRIIGE